MATSKHTAEVGVEIKSPGTPAVISDWEKLSKLIDDLPEKLKKAGGGTKELTDQLQALAAIFKKGMGSDGVSKGEINALKDQASVISGLLKTMKAITAGTKAVLPPDLTTAINQAERLTRAYTAAGLAAERNAKIKSGTFGLDSTSLKGADAALRALQARIVAAKQQMNELGLDNRMTRNPVVQESKILQKNLGALTGHREGLITQAEDLKRARDTMVHERQQKAQWRSSLMAEEQKQEAADLKRTKETARHELQQKALWKQTQRVEEEKLAAEDLKRVQATARHERDQKAQWQTSHLTETQKQAAEDLKRVQATARHELQQKAQWRSSLLAEEQRQAAEDLKRAQATANHERDQKAGWQSSLLQQKDGRKVVQANNAVFAQGEGFDATVAKGFQANQQTLRDYFGLTKQMLNSSVEVRQVLRQAHPIAQALTAELTKTKGVDNERTIELTQQLEVLRKQTQELKQAQSRKDPKLHEGEKANAMLARSTGQGGAALLAVQATLIANYSVLQGMIGTIRSAITTSVELEAAFRNVQAVTATTSAEMVGLEAKIKSVAAGTRFSAIEVAGAALTLGQAGMSAKEVGTALESVVKLASAAGTTLAQAVDLVTSVVGVFDKSVNDTADIANKITQASNSSKISVDKLALGLQYAGNIASQSGVSFEETTAAMAAMSNAGIKSGSTMGTGLRQFLVEVQKPSKEFLSTLHQLGLSLSDVDMRSNGLIGVVSKLRAAGFTASEAIKSFDVRGAAAFNALLADPAGLERQYKGLLDTRAAVAANEIQMDSLQAQAKRLTTSFGNLASTGLAPLSSILQSTAGGLATLLQTMSEYPTLTKGMVTATAVFMGLGLTRHFLDIAIGGLKLLGVQGVLATSMTTLATATVGSTVASVRATLANTALGVSAVGATGMTWSLTAAVTALRTAFMSLSLLTGIGVVLTGLTLAYVGLSAVIGNTKEEIDALKAASNEAKSAVESKTGAIKSLSDKIEDLQYKEKILTANTDTLTGSNNALRLAARELNSQFGHLGVQIDTTNPKFDDMVRALQRVKAEMVGIAGLKMGAQIREEEKLLAKQVEVLESENNKVRGGQIFKLKNLIDSPEVQNNPAFSTSQRQAVAGHFETIRDPSKATELAKAQAAAMWDILGEAMVTPAQKKTLASIREAFAPLHDSALAAVTTRTNLGTLKGAKGDFLDAQKFQASPLFGGKTLEASLPSRYDALDFAKNQNPELAGAELYDTTRKDLVQRIVTIGGLRAQLKAMVKKGDLNPKVGDDELTRLNNLEQQFVTKGQSLATEFKPYLDARVEDNINKLSKPNKGDHSKLRTGATDAQRLLAIAEEKARGLMEVAYGTSDENRVKGEVARSKAQAEANAVTANANRGAQDDNTNQVIAAHKRKYESLNLMAKGRQISAETTRDLEKIPDWMDKGLADLQQARLERLEELRLTQEKRVSSPDTFESTKPFKDAEIAAVNAEEDEKQRKYIHGFRELTTKVAKALDKSTRKMETLTKQEIFDELREKGEEKFYEAGEPVRALESEVTSGRRVESDPLLLKAKLAQTQVGYANLVSELNMLGTETTGWLGATIATYELARKATQDIQDKLDELRAKSLAGMTDAQRVRHFADLEYYEGLQPAAQDKEKSAFGDVKRVRGLQQGTRRNLDTAQVSIDTQQRAIPQEATWDSLNAKMDETWLKYQSMVQGMDVNKTFGEGMFGVLSGLQGTFSTFFTSLVSGSKEAGGAFRNMAISIIKSMLDMLAQALAMQALKSIIGMFMPGMANYSLASASAAPTGGLGLNMGGGVGLKMAKGGPVRGGIPGKDSVGILGMPGEFMLRKSAVDAVGEDFLRDLNAQTTSTVSSSPGASASSKKREPDTTNIWIVSPETKPTVGPKDIIMVITDDMMRGGATRQLVKQIQTGG